MIAHADCSRWVTAMAGCALVGSAFAAGTLPPVDLTHFSLTLDPETYVAFRESPAIASLAATEERHTTGGDRSWTGFYVYGRQTFIELYSDALLPTDVRAGDCSIGLGSETPGTLSGIVRNLKQDFGNAVTEERVPRHMGERVIPWFTAASIQVEPSDGMDIWFDEIDPGYLSAMYPDTPVLHPLSRAEYLSHHFRAEQLLDNVLEIDASVTDVQLERFRKELADVDWTIKDTPNGFRARGPTTTLSFDRSDAQNGIRAVTLHLRRAHRKETVQLGRALLSFDGRQATIVFDTQNKKH